MLSWMKRARIRGCVFLLCLSLLLMGYAALSLSAVEDDFQHLWIAPPQQAPLTAQAEPQALPEMTNAGLRDAREKLVSVREQLQGAVSELSLFALASPAAISVKDGGNAAARLEAIQTDAYGIKTLELFCGRLIYPEEFDRGERVVLVDEQLAVALFQYAEPLERDVEIAGESYRIVGIVRDHRQVGDEQLYSAYVPYRAMEKSSLPLNALCLQATPVPGAGGWAAFLGAVGVLGEGATLNLTKEVQSGLLPLRMLGVALGMAVLLLFLRFLNVRSLGFGKQYQARLRDEYALGLMPWLLSRGGLLLLGYGVAVGVFAWLFTVLVAPVYTFPEWVPAVLVEPKDIETAFWNVWQGMAKTVEMRSPELIRIQFFSRFLAWAAGGAALSGGVLWGRLGSALMPYLRKDE